MFCIFDNRYRCYYNSISIFAQKLQMEQTLKIRRIYNQDILIVLKERYGFSLDYIRKSLRGDRIGLMPEKINKEYDDLEYETRRAISDALKNMI